MAKREQRSSNARFVDRRPKRDPAAIVSQFQHDNGSEAGYALDAYPHPSPAGIVNQKSAALGIPHRFSDVEIRSKPSQTIIPNDLSAPLFSWVHELPGKSRGSADGCLPGTDDMIEAFFGFRHALAPPRVFQITNQYAGLAFPVAILLLV